MSKVGGKSSRKGCTLRGLSWRARRLLTINKNSCRRGPSPYGPGRSPSPCLALFPISAGPSSLRRPPPPPLPSAGHTRSPGHTRNTGRACALHSLLPPAVPPLRSAGAGHCATSRTGAGPRPERRLPRRLRKGVRVEEASRLGLPGSQGGRGVTGIVSTALPSMQTSRYLLVKETIERPNKSHCQFIFFHLKRLEEKRLSYLEWWHLSTSLFF
ncbi:uncharacterized protein ACIGJ3_008758 [Trichechus inunguis]